MNDDNIKKEAVIYEVIEGDVTKIMADGKIFVLEKEQFKGKMFPESKVYKISEYPLLKRSPDTKGRIIDKISGCYIYEYELQDIKNAIEKKMSVREMREIIIEYHPNVKPVTIGVYLRGYIRYIEIKSEYRMPKVKISPKRRKKKRIIPEGAVGWSERYQTNIWRDEYNKVIKAINYIGYGYKATTAQIAEQAKMAKQRVRAVLNFLMEIEKSISYKTDDKSVRVYHFVRKKEE